MIDIHPQHLTLAKLLDRRLFCVPEYQRAYSWTSSHRKDLFEDIERVQAKGKKASHYMAAIVCLHRKGITLGTDEFDKLDIVDGQQRLTTLIILLNAIKLALNPGKPAEKKIERELGELLVKVDGDNLLLLQTNHDTSHHFSDFLREGTAQQPDSAETIADRELLKAIVDCRKFVENWQGRGENLPALTALIKNRLSLLLYEISDEESVYTVFEVINSRGMEVAWLDRLKSILMGAAFELKKADQEQLIRELQNIWCDIYTQIGLRQGLSTEALRFAATLWVPRSPNRLLSERAAVEALRGVPRNAAEIRKVARWLLKVTKACDDVIANDRLNAVTRISQARLLAVAIHLRRDIKASEQKELLVQWEKVSFRIYGMLNKDARTGVGDFTRLAHRIIKGKISPEETLMGLKKIGADYTIEEAVEALRKSNCYEGWGDKLRYFMFRYEEYLAKEEGLNFRNEQWEKIWAESSSKSIEHIWPQSKAPDDVKHTLGNLMLLPLNLNSALQDKSPKEKRDAYLKTGLLIAGKVASVSKLWSRKTIKDREEEILKWAAVEWAD